MRGNDDSGRPPPPSLRSFWRNRISGTSLLDLMPYEPVKTQFRSYFDDAIRTNQINSLMNRNRKRRQPSSVLRTDNATQREALHISEVMKTDL
ncbi:hypothetical protein CPB85DRAFT_1356198 [Mucidula mucida]|nr:hypothetical protein CPB85DRAFT_1356198 [Mucidula mucida]